jgi:hypothetical protein
MKKIILFVVAAMFSATAFSQFGVQAGGNISAFSGSTLQNKAIAGYQVGFVKDLGEWGDRFSIEPGIFLIHKGGKTGDLARRLNYLQLPINTKVNFYFGDARFFIGYGIYGACGLWGSSKTGKEKTDLEFGKNKDVRRFDVGGQAFLGVMVGRMGLKFMYQPGSRDLSENSGTRNTSYILNFTYLFSDPL